LAFPASEVSDLRFERDGVGAANGQTLTEVQVTFMGLVGPSGVLPQPYTELFIERHVQHRDDAAHAFLDLFSHRMTALFYEAWQKYRFHIEFERRGRSDFQRYLLNLVGFGPQARRRLFDEGGSSLREDFFAYFSGVFSHRPRNAVNLQAMLAFYFQVPVEVQLFAGRWLRLEAEQCTQLGRRNAVLGNSAVAGDRTWDYQSNLRIGLGPLNLADYRRFQPGTQAYRRLMEILRFYLGAEFDFEIELHIRPEEIPIARLQRGGEVALGWQGWLKRPGRQGLPSRGAVFRVSYEGVYP